MNFDIVRAVWKRDLASWFGNPTGWIFIVLFVLGCCAFWLFGGNGAFFTNNLANLDTLNDFWFPVLATVFVSASTMNIWASERSNGTQELLFTLPGADFDLQFGKFLSAVSVYTMALLFTLVMPLTLNWLGDPDMGQIFANYVGYWLFGVMLVSASMVGSQLTNNGTVALLLSLVICFAVVYAGTVLTYLTGSKAWETNGPIGQFRLFAGGEIPFSGVLLFVGLTVAFFSLGLALLGRRLWREGIEWVHGALRFVGFAVCAAALTIIGVYSLPRVDATVEGIHSLGDETRKLLADLDPERPVFITAYVSEEVPEAFVQQRKLLLNLLDQFDALGGAAVEKQVIIPEPFSPEARRAESEFGIRAQQVTVQMTGGGLADLQMFLGFAVQSGTNEVVTPFVGPAAPLEYELMRSIRTVSNAGRRKVGILKTDVELAGGFDMQTFQQKPRWAIATELEQQYEIENVDADSDYPEGLDCLIVPQASSLEQGPMDRLQQWVLAGNPTLLLEDPMPVDQGAQGTAADDPKGGPQAQMMGGGGPQKGNWNGFLTSIGLDAPVGEIVWDLSYQTFPGRVSSEYLFVRENGMSDAHAITRGLQSAVMLYTGHVHKREGATVDFVPLLESVVNVRASEKNGNGIVQKSDLFQRNFFGGMQLNPSPPRRSRNERLPLAARVTGKVGADSEQALNLIYVADLDLISNVFFQMRSSMADANVRFDNVTFALNCIDTLAGDESLIELRKRRPKLRKLTRIEEEQLAFENEWQLQKQQAETAAKDALDEADERFQEAVARIEDDAQMDAQAKRTKIEEVRSVEQRRLDLKKAQIEENKNRKLEEATHDRDAAKRGIYDGYRVIVLVLAAVPGLLLGLLTFVRRSMRAASIVPQNRQVGGSN